MSRRIAIIGAGPIGLEAALFATQKGFEVSVLERGRVAENVRAWGHVRLFSPFEMNSSPWGRGALKESGYEKIPADDALLTGCEFAEQYLIPLSQHPKLARVVRENTEVAAIGRADCWKGDLTGASRQESPFRILVRSQEGEDLIESDFVLDCSGTYPNHNWLGAGGIPCPGETENQQQLTWTLPDVAGNDRERFQGKRTLVVGSGYSAATTVVALADLARESPGTNVVWLTRSKRELPIGALPDDQLTERAELTWPDSVLVGSRIKRVGNSSLQIEHQLFSEKVDGLISDAVSTMVAFDFDQQKTIPVSDEIKAAIRKLEGDREIEGL